MDKLQSYKGEYFYEATKEEPFGCSYLLQDAANITVDKIVEGVNVMGTILKEIRDKHRR